MSEKRELVRFGAVICASLLLGAVLAAGQSIVLDPGGSPAASIPGPVDIQSGEYDAGATPPALDVGGSWLRLGDADSPTSQSNGLGIKFTDIGNSNGALIYDPSTERFVLCESSGSNALTCDGGSETLRIDVDTGEVTVPNGDLRVGGGHVVTESRDVNLGRPLDSEQTNPDDDPRYWGLLELEDGESRIASGVISSRRGSFARGTSLYFHAETGWDGDNSGDPADSTLIVDLLSGNADSFSRLVEFDHDGSRWIGIERDPGGCCNNGNIQFTGQASADGAAAQDFPQIFGPDEVTAVADYSGPEDGGAGAARFGGDLSMGGNDITNVGEVQSTGADYDLQTWGGYTGQSSGNQVFGPFSPSSGNSHYIEKIAYSEYHLHRYGQLRDGSGTPVVEAIDCDNWGSSGGERGEECVYEFPYPVEMTGQWDLRIVDYSDGSNRRLSLTAFGFEGPSGLYDGKQGWAAGDHIDCGSDSWCTVDTYTVPSGTTLHITGMAFSTRHTYSIMRIEDGSGTTLVEGVTLGDHDWGNSMVEFGRAKTVSAGTDVRLRVYNDDGSSRDVKAMMWGYTEQ